MSNLFGFVGTIVIGFFSLFLITFLIALMLAPLMILDCNSKWSSYEHRWDFIAGCMVKADGKWIPEDNYRAFDNQK